MRGLLLGRRCGLSRVRAEPRAGTGRGLFWKVVHAAHEAAFTGSVMYVVRKSSQRLRVSGVKSGMRRHKLRTAMTMSLCRLYFGPYIATIVRRACSCATHSASVSTPRASRSAHKRDWYAMQVLALLPDAMREVCQLTHTPWPGQWVRYRLHCTQLQDIAGRVWTLYAFFIGDFVTRRERLG